jgi:1-acyl-sn-glycerol-3-phosphate acyltransferase
MPGDVPPRPSERNMRGVVAALEPMRRWVNPQVSGLDNLPDDGRFLLVGNHSLYSAYDFLILTELFRRRGIVVRGLADRDQLKIPVWKDILPGIGGVEGSRENCAELMRQGEVVLVFPGGSREVWKKPGQRYRLLWGERVGFARMAIAHGYPIVPLSQLGGDEIYDIVLDVEHPLAGPYRALVDRLGARRDNVPSFGLGWAKTALPRPQDAYIHFGRPIDTAQLAGRHEDRSACESVRDQVREAIDHGLEQLGHERAAKGNPGLARRLARFITAGRQQ